MPSLSPHWIAFEHHRRLAHDEPASVIAGHALAPISSTSSATARSPAMPVAVVTVDTTAATGGPKTICAVSHASRRPMSTDSAPNTWRSTGPTIDRAAPRASTARLSGASTGMASAPGTSSA